jgi:hypothetical protein
VLPAELKPGEWRWLEADDLTKISVAPARKI